MRLQLCAVTVAAHVQRGSIGKQNHADNLADQARQMVEENDTADRALFQADMSWSEATQQERLALAVRYPSAFVKLTVGGAEV